MEKTQTWQKPFVDVFKRFNCFQVGASSKRGQVFVQQDNRIGRQIFKITGNISASNYVNIHDSGDVTKPLGLIGRYLYLEFLPVRGHIFNIHLDFLIRGQEQSTRFTISNMYDNYKVTSGNILQIPFPKNAPEKYTVMVLDIQYHLENFGIFQSTGIQNFDHIHQLKSAQICSFILFRGMYTSDNIYEIKSLPKELNFKLTKEQEWSRDYQLVYYPTEMDPEFLSDMAKDGPPPMEQIEKEIKKQGDPVISAELNEMKKSLTNMKQTHDSLELQENLDPQLDFDQRQFQLQSISKQSNQDDLAKKSIYSSKQVKKTQIDGLQPYPILKLQHTIGFSGRCCPDIKFSKHPECPNEIIYASGSILVSAELGSTNQKFFQGHTSPISCLDVSRDGAWMATGQEGNTSIIKIWDYLQGDCLSTFQAPYINIMCISFSYNRKLLCTVGQDQQNRENIIIWNIDELELKKKPEILAKQMSDFSIISMKFSPIELDKLISCGRENIRFWRIKNGHLPAGTVVLNHHARNTVFTVFDYEFAYEEPSAAKQFGKVKRVFIGSKAGMLYQVNYNTRELEGVFKCHDLAICSISLSAGFCITGSEDQFLRVWPLDFSEFLIEAKHEGVVISLDISQDALQVACGTSTGGLGVLDLSNHNYKTFLRSHIDEILQMTIHPYSNYLISLSADLSIRIWDLTKYEQIYEFSYPADDTCTCIAAYPKGMTFAGGFSSGVFRIFDIEQTSIIKECKFHDAQITSIVFSDDGKQLYVADINSFYSVYDVNRNYQHVKTFEQELPSEFQSIAISQDGFKVATIGDSGTHINIYDAHTFQNVLKIFCPNTIIKKLIFANNNVELFVITSSSKIKVFAFQENELGLEPYLIRELSSVHRQGLSDLSYTQNYKYLASVGTDQLVKIWDYEFSLQGPSSNQIFLGHSSKVNQCIFVPDTNKLLTCGGLEGIYEWEFLGDLSPGERNIEYSGTQPAHIKRPFSQKPKKLQTTVSKNMDYSQNEYEVQEEYNENFENEFKVNESDYEEQKVDDQQQINVELKKTEQEILTHVSMQVEQQQQKIVAKVLNTPFEPKQFDFKYQQQKLDRNILNQRYIPNSYRDKNSLPFRQHLTDKKASDLNEKIRRIQDNPDNFKLNNLIGYNNDTHDNLVWNYVNGWFGYTVENLLIVEQLGKDRQQKIVTLPNYISCVQLSRDSRYVVVGSSTTNDKDSANIYILDSNLMAFKVVRTFVFHSRGIQGLQFTCDGKFLVSIGNFKECTIAVWDWEKGKLLASSYTLDKINDLKISNQCFSSDRVFEFMTVGRDQVQFWAFTKNQKLEYYDIFVPKSDDIIPEVTCCDYIEIQGNQYSICGLKGGDVILIKYGEFEILNRVQVCNQEIVQMNGGRGKVMLLSLDGFIGVWNCANLQDQIEPYFSQIGFPGLPICASFEPQLNEALISSYEGGIYYFNIGNNYKSLLTGAIDQNHEYQINLVSDSIFVSSHANGSLKLWNTKTAEEIITYNLKSQATAYYCNPNTSKLMCFFKNNNEIKVFDLKKLTNVETYINSEYINSDKVSDVYVVQVLENIIGGTMTRWILNNKGELFSVEQSSLNRVKTQRLTKIFDFQKQVLIQVFSERSTIFVIDQRGQISSLQVEFKSDQEQPFKFIEVDQFDIFFNDEDADIQIEKINKNTDSITSLAFDKAYQSSYIVCNNLMQHVFVRNYQKKQVVQKINLMDFPTCLAIEKVTSQGSIQILVGTNQGFLEKINIEDREDRAVLQNMLDGPVTNIQVVRGKQQVIIQTKNGICLYSI